LGSQNLLSFYQELGLFDAPQIRLPTASTSVEEVGFIFSNSASLAALGINSQNGSAALKISPLQAAIVASTLSNSGTRPAPQIALAVDNPESGWEFLPPLSTPSRALTPQAVRQAADDLSITDLPIWESVSYGYDPGHLTVSWYIAGTLPDWQGIPLGLALVIEAQDAALALEIGRSIMAATLRP
jgi:hypothetical protein